MLRDTYPGELRAADVGREVRLAGWVARRRDHGGLIFIDLRDRSGMVQLVVDPVARARRARARRAGAPRVRARGRRQGRGAHRPRPSTPSCRPARSRCRSPGSRSSNRAKTPPFEVEAAEQVDVDETLRLKYRYLDLRRAAMLANLELRNAATQARRAYLNAHRFIEVETPDLTKSSPEGARDFLVPSRLQPHHFYALPQSPQMFKQILMVAGLDRYYQFARCFRDEDLRADRQPEHTQIDIETSFLAVPEIRELLEGLMTAIFEGVGETPPATPLPRALLRRGDAALRLGQAGPALRLRDRRAQRDLRRERVQGVPRRRRRRAASCAPSARPAAVPSPGPRSTSSPSSPRSTAPRAWPTCTWRRAARCAAPSSSSSREAEQAALVDKVGGEPGDLVVFAADEAPVAAEVLGALRLALIGLLAPEPSASLVAALGRGVPALRDRQGDGHAHLRAQPLQPADRGDHAAHGERPAAPCAAPSTTWC